MTNFTPKLNFIVLIIFSFSINKTYCQAADETLELARKLHNEGNLKASFRIYNRVDFFDKSLLKSEDYINLYNYYLLDNQIAQCEYYLNLAINLEPNILKKGDLKLKFIDLLTREYKNDEAIIYLLGLDESEYLINNFRINLYFGINYYFLKNNIESKSYFKKAFSESKNSIIDSLFKADENYQHKYRPKKIKTLNLILPGLGSAFLGEYKNSINSLILTSLLGVYAGRTIVKYSIIDAMVGVLPWLQRYYMGAATKSEILAQKKIDKKHIQILSSLLAIKNSIL